MNRIRRSMLFIPGNNPGMVQNGDVFDSDGIIFDLEDSVALEEKDAARELVKNALETFPFNAEIIVRINPIDSPFFVDDIVALKKLPISMILLSKASVEGVKNLEKHLEGTNINIMVLIESAMGVEKVFDILNTSERCLGLMLGGEDLCVDLNCKRTKSGQELLYARMRVINAAKALQKFCIDTPFTDVNDEEGLQKDTEFAKSLGFDGKAAINPRQIITINNVFSPSEQDIKHALRVLEARDLALKEGKGVFALDGKMVDLPIIKRAEYIIEVAKKLKLVSDNDET